VKADLEQTSIGLTACGVADSPGIVPNILSIDAAAESHRISSALKEQTLLQLRRRGVVLGLSGGIDSSVTAALCVAALGSEHVLAVLMPEHDSDPDSLHLGRLVADHLQIRSVVENIGPTLQAMGCYHRRDEAIRKIVPEFASGWRCKVVLANALTDRGYNISSLVVETPTGEQRKFRMPLEVYLAVIAATNMKQRVRKQLEYYYADRLNYVVAGTPNRLEYDQGFFVKNGDGSADIKPIAHLYKSQVYQLAQYFRIPQEVQVRPPTTDTWSLAQTQEEFYFSVPYPVMDLCLYGLNAGEPAEKIAGLTGLTSGQVESVWQDIRAKRRATAYLHKRPLLVEAIEPIQDNPGI
jgi:NAD+ synthase